jgi:hypothetical protein
MEEVTTPGACSGSYTITRTWTATDECEKSAVHVQVLTVVDTTGPVIGTSASNESAECDGSGNSTDLTAWLNSHGGATATDACGTVTWTNNYGTDTGEVSLSEGCGDTGEVTVTFTATDDCGNSSSTTATFAIEDTTGPTIDTAASNQSYEYNASDDRSDEFASWLSNLGGAHATDVCGTVTWTHNYTSDGLDGFTSGCGVSQSATVTFTATDACGNTTL